jgi:PAS domain S-box-containing protein
MTPARTDAPEAAGGVRLAALIANVPGAIYRCAHDAEWTMTLISGEIERISGYPPEDFVASARRTFISVVEPEDRERVLREVDEAVAAGVPFSLEYRIRRPDGSFVWVLDRGQLVFEVDGSTWLDGVLFDITERRRAEEFVRQYEAEQARVEELRDARLRIIEAADAARRRLERDLHDGAQQRLVALSLQLRLIRSRLPEASEVAPLADRALAELAEATAELRELARGLHPAVLTDKGLPAAVAGLADRAPLPVEVDCRLVERLPPAVEAAAYYLIAEALTNVVRYADASHARVSVVRGDGHAVVEVQDDGAGGADPTAGSGLRGLADRIEALEGRLEIESEPGAGTTVRASIPAGAG